MQESNGTTVMVQGRLVWTSGDLFKGQPKLDPNTKQPKVDKNGEPVREYGFGLAVPKDVLNQMGEGEAGHIWAVIHQEAQSIYPNGAPSDFSYKYKDGDGVDHKGVPYSQREGYAGHLVFACTTQIPIKFFKWENNQNILVNEGIKCGDYVNVQLQVKAHGPVGQGKAGLYLNPMAVQFLGHGKEIVNTPSGDQIFGTSQPPLPPGASATPLAPQGGQQLVPNPQPAVAPPQPQGMPAPSGAPAPHHGVLPQPHQPQAPAPAAAPPQPQGMPAPSGAPVPGGVPQFNANEPLPQF